MRNALVGLSIHHLLIGVAILFPFTSRVHYCLAVHLSSFQFKHLSASHLPSHPILESDLASDDLFNTNDESLIIPQLASINSIASGDEKYLSEEIWRHIATRSGIKFQDVVRLGATDRTRRHALRDILPRDAGILNELCHFITTSGESTVKSIMCRLPYINRDIYNILSDQSSSDKIHLQLRALNHLLEGKANQININIEDHRDDDKRKATYLMLGARDGLLKVVKLLLENHANV